MVYEVEIDISYFLFFGYIGEILVMFKISNMIIDNYYLLFIMFVCYIEVLLMVGFSVDLIVKFIVKIFVVVIINKGKGLIIGFVDNI